MLTEHVQGTDIDLLVIWFSYHKGKFALVSSYTSRFIKIQIQIHPGS